MPGPLPQDDKRRRNAPTIPTTALPVSGFAGVIPDAPDGYNLGTQGRDWWAWAWRTPQAAGWSDGDLYTLARRASIEDDIKAIDMADISVDLELLSDEAGVVELQAQFKRIKGLVSGRLSILKEARDLDDRLGLTPKGLAALRWKIVADKSDDVGASGHPKPKGKTYGHLKSAG
jgi:hypothetical protein